MARYVAIYDLEWLTANPLTGEIAMTTWLRYLARPLTLTVACALAARVSPAQDRASVASPDGRNRVTVEIRDGGLTYRVDRDGRAVLLPSRLGFTLDRKSVV